MVDSAIMHNSPRRSAGPRAFYSNFSRTVSACPEQKGARFGGVRPFVQAGPAHL
jgi:hypothetical protein